MNIINFQTVHEKKKTFTHTQSLTQGNTSIYHLMFSLNGISLTSHEIFLFNCLKSIGGKLKVIIRPTSSAGWYDLIGKNIVLTKSIIDTAANL